MVTAMIILFILGYVLIAFEHQAGVNKTATALILGMILWTMYIFSGASAISSADTVSFHNFLRDNPEYARRSLAEQAIQYVVNLQIIDHLGSVAEILFYLLGAMTIVEIIDIHGGFDGITMHIHTRSKKKLLWLVALITFFMSSVLDNMTSAIVMMMLLQKLLENQRERWLFGSIVIIAANAGGAWTPIGDVTTIMLWIGDNITSGDVIRSLFLPSIVSLALPVWLISFSLKGNMTEIIRNSDTETSVIQNKQQKNMILFIGIICLLAVPVFKSFTHLPPFAGIMLTLGLFWIYIDMLYNHHRDIPENKQFRVPKVLSKVDISTILFFMGILMAVAALEAIGVLHDLSVFLNNKFHNVYLLSLAIGMLSSIIDNVPLVAAAMGMYPVLTPAAARAMPDPSYMMSFVQDGKFWELIAYCAGTGGSILIIGSAAGVVVMGLEKINFIWYLKHISWIAFIGFLSGIGCYYILEKL